MPVKAKKYKRLTRAEKAFNKEFKERMIAEGVLPTPKPKLNRKKFISETMKEFKEMNKFEDIRYLYEAIGIMIPSSESRRAITPEQVGVGKLLRLAIELRKFNQDKHDKGETKYKLDELYEKAIKPILDL